VTSGCGDGTGSGGGAAGTTDLAAVFVEIGLEGKLARASRTLIVLRDRVGLDVSAQVGTVGEGLSTMSAAERSFAGV